MNKKLLKNMDFGVLICVLILLSVGLIALFSTTQNTGHDEFIKQIIWFVISIPFCIMAVIIDYERILKIAPAFYGVCLFLLVLVLFTAPINGARSWFSIGPLSFQPSEFGKIGLILFLAYTLNLIQARGKKEINKFHKLLLVLLIAALPLGLIIIEPDFGTATAYIFATLFIIFVSGINKKYIFAFMLLLAIVIPSVYLNLPEHALKRIEVFMHPDSDPRGAGYNIIQSKLAIGAR